MMHHDTLSCPQLTLAHTLTDSSTSCTTQTDPFYHLPTTDHDVQDIRYAEKSTPCIPHRVQKQQLKILVTGQPETGRTTAIKNLFASIAEDPDWCPTDVAGLTMSDFCATPERFTTTVSNRKDTGGHLSISYVIQVSSQISTPILCLVPPSVCKPCNERQLYFQHCVLSVGDPRYQGGTHGGRTGTCKLHAHRARGVR